MMSLLHTPEAVQALSALAQGTRLAVFRILVKAGSDGLSAGEIAREVGVIPNTLSSHMTILASASLVEARRSGRSIIYSANYVRMNGLIQFLIDDCCGGRPELCFPGGACTSTREETGCA
jgi:DNA-binding transcriptional ArsR family regulator